MEQADFIIKFFKPRKHDHVAKKEKPKIIPKLEENGHNIICKNHRRV